MIASENHWAYAYLKKDMDMVVSSDSKLSEQVSSGVMVCVRKCVREPEGETVWFSVAYSRKYTQRDKDVYLVANVTTDLAKTLMTTVRNPDGTSRKPVSKFTFNVFEDLYSKLFLSTKVKTV